MIKTWALIAMCVDDPWAKSIYKNIQKYIFENACLLSKFSKIKPFENFPLYGMWKGVQ